MRGKTKDVLLSGRKYFGKSGQLQQQRLQLTNSKMGNKPKRWLQRNIIDQSRVCPSVGGMGQIELREEKPSVVLHCAGCGGLMRLVGSEPHPVQMMTDLFTYVCTSCDECLVVPSPDIYFSQSSKKG
jgi:hypothetical protein